MRVSANVSAALTGGVIGYNSVLLAMTLSEEEKNKSKKSCNDNISLVLAICTGFSL